MCSVQIIPHRAGIVLLDDLHDDGAIRLGKLLQDFILGVVSLQPGLVVGNLLLNGFHRVIVLQVLF